MCARIMFALNSMKSDIQILMNVYKQKKRKVSINQCIWYLDVEIFLIQRSQEQSVAHSDISEPPTVQIACPSPARAGTDVFLPSTSDSLIIWIAIVYNG